MIYLNVACKVNVQKIQESPPSTRSRVMVFSPRMADITYNGDVPISPNTIPIVTRSVAAVISLGIVFIRLVDHELRRLNAQRCSGRIFVQVIMGFHFTNIYTADHPGGSFGEESVHGKIK